MVAVFAAAAGDADVAAGVVLAALFMALMFLIARQIRRRPAVDRPDRRT